MNRATQLAVFAVGLFLLLSTGMVGKPGLPPTLKADEPAYLAMAMSLIGDGDLRCLAEDFRRLLDTYPYLPIQNLILMSDDGWQTVYFGKPFIYSLLGAPFVAVFGANGLVALNALLFVFMIWCGAWYLKRWNTEPIALLYATLFFVLSPAWAYVFWLQPEIFNMASVTAAFTLVLGSSRSPRWSRYAVPASGVALALGVYNKPVLMAFALPLGYAVWKKAGLRKAGAWLAAVAIALAALAGGSLLLTGHPSPYLGMARAGIKVGDPQAAQESIERLTVKLAKTSKYANSWAWVFRRPPTSFPEVRQSLGYFFWGRHTGFLIYLPFAVVSLLLFVIHRRRAVEGWLSLAAMATITLFFICVIPLNWHGGGGFIGNRYFIMCYPAFLFLVTSIRPAWLMLPGTAAAGVFLGAVLFTPLGAPVPLPTLQAHTRSPQFEMLPLELSLRQTVPGYSVFAYSRVVLIGRKDVVMPHRGRDGLPWVQGRVPVEIIVLTDRLIQGLFFKVRTFHPVNDVELEFAGDRARLEFEGGTRKADLSRVIELQPKKEPRRFHEQGALYYVYRMTVETSGGHRIYDRAMPSEVFFAGIELDFIGRRDQITRPEHYRVEWLDAQAPPEVAAGQNLSLPVRLRNASQTPFDSTGSIPVKMSYRWRVANGTDLGRAGKRTNFAQPLPPGEELSTVIEVETPKVSGDYQLELDLVREHVAWFSDVESPAKVLDIRVLPPSP